MAYIDSTYYSDAGVGGAQTGSAPTGGTGATLNANAGANVSGGVVGSSGTGAGMSVTAWVIIFFVITGIILTGAGVIFNKKKG